MPISTLNNILIAVAEGNEASFEELFHLYKQQVYAYAMHFTHRESTSEEIVQDIFLKLWLHKEDLTRIKCFEPYLYTITRNLCFNYLKKFACERALKQELSLSQKTLEDSAESTVIYRDYENLIQQILELLPPQQKKIYTLNFFQGQKQEEIAQSLHISRNTVKVHIAKARETVRKYLAAHIDLIIFLLITVFARLL